MKVAVEPLLRPDQNGLLVCCRLTNCKLASGYEHKLGHNLSSIDDVISCFERSSEQVDNNFVDKALLELAEK